MHRPAKRFWAVKLFLSLLLITVLIGHLPATAAAASNRAVNEARSGVVRIYTGPYFSHGVQYYSTGSGFAVGVGGASSDIFITNYHVVADAPDDVYIILTDEDGEYVKCELLAYNDDIDFAILQAERVINERISLCLMPSSAAEVAEDVFALGFPGTSDVFSSGALDSTIDDITVTAGTISKKLTASDGIDYVQHDAAIHSGNSGGPLLTEEGYVIGMNTLGFTYDNGSEIAGAYYALSINYIMGALDQLNIRYDYVDSRSDVTNTTSGSESSVSQGNPGQDSPQQVIIVQQPIGRSESSNNTFYYIIGGAAAVCVIIILIVAIVLWRKMHKLEKRASAPPRRYGPDGVQQAVVQLPQQQNVTDPNAPTLKVQGLSGVFAGKIIDSQAAVVFGRDAKRCSVVFPADTKGVSGVHCELRPLPNGQAILIDRGSSFGTMVGGVRRIAVGQEVVLQPGTVISLGSEQQRFVVNPRK